MKCLLLAFTLLLPLHISAEEITTKNLTMSVTARIEYDTNGQVLHSEIIDNLGLKPTFIELIQTSLSHKHFEPHKVDGNPVRFLTGVRLELSITSDNNSMDVEIKDYEIFPLTKKSFYLPTPRSLVFISSKSPIRVSCIVGVDGSCTSIDVDVPVGIPRSDAIKYTKSMFSQWKFEPQQVNGIPVEGLRILTFKFNSKDLPTFENIRLPRIDQSMHKFPP